MFRTVVFTSRAYAEALHGRPTTGMISITNPSGKPADLDPDQWGALLRLEFDDAIDDDLHQPGDDVFMTPRHARTVLDWLELHGDLEDIHVHCEAGVSRSAAVAAFIAKLSGFDVGDGLEFANHYVYQMLVAEHVARRLRKRYQYRDGKLFEMVCEADAPSGEKMIVLREIGTERYLTEWIWFKSDFCCDYVQVDHDGQEVVPEEYVPKEPSQDGEFDERETPFYRGPRS